MKEVQAYLSIVGFIQTLLLAVALGAINEYFKTNPDKDRLLLLFILTISTFCLAFGIYRTIIEKSRHKKK